MTNLPVIVSFGGINAAGRSSGHNGFRRLIFDQTNAQTQKATLQQLAALTGQIQRTNGIWRDAEGSTIDVDDFLAKHKQDLLDGTLIRKFSDGTFDPDAIPIHQRVQLEGAGSEPICFNLKRRDLPNPVPAAWQITCESSDPEQLTIRTDSGLPVMLPSFRASEVHSAAQLPQGFDPAGSYPSRNHPRALQMTVFGASDAVNALGLDWETIRKRVPADQISVYAGSCLGQLDYNGNGGMLKARLLGKKVTSKQLPLGLNEMPADFINAYLLGSLGTTGHNNGACATFLYNLRQGMRDIQSGSHRIALVGTSESCMVPEVFEAFITMGALASDNSLRQLDGLNPDVLPDYRRACRPFCENSGFTLAESAQFVVLFDDELAMETGATVYGAVNDIFIHADGFKKSITGPGLGNYLTVAKALAATRNVIGEQRTQRNSFVQAHGTGTPQNRVSESEILNRLSATFGIEKWPVAAIKSQLGHSVASASGDQIIASLGVWSENILPKIAGVDQLADDVATEHLDFLLTHRELAPESMDAALINAKGFGGNNATASILSPHVTRRMLSKRHGKKAVVEYTTRNESVMEEQERYNTACSEGKNQTIYKFDHGVMSGEDLAIDTSAAQLSNGSPEISLNVPHHFSDMCD